MKDALTPQALPPVGDIHTHNLLAPAGDAIIAMPKQWLLQPSQFAPRPGAFYSCGIHPWWTADAAELPLLIAGFEALVVHPQVVALGECGFDRLRGADLALQERVFLHQTNFAPAASLPLVLHCVRAFDVLLRLRKQSSAPRLWVIHGFRGNPVLARQLLSAGFRLSFGTHYNAESFALTPPDCRYRETDEDF
ncbi:MAG: TatD family hydrolase [Bacteroidales bacterium]|nr:TatD family hydrolase [Bacteroidales bacterium]